MNKIKFAIIGIGHIGKRHAEMINRNESAELVGLIDILSPEECKVEHLNIPFFKTINEFMESGIEVDVINVCTPNGLHFEHSVDILNHRKHLVCEKPMGLTKAQCEQIVFKSLDVSKKVFCVMQNRYSPPSEWLKKVISDKTLGEIFIVQLNCYWNRDNRYYKKGHWKGTKDLDGGTLFTQFSHFIDIMYWLFGDITNIQARFKDFIHQDSTEFEDSGIINFDFVNGGIGSINYSTAIAHQNLESSITIIGEKGSVKVGGQYMNEVLVCDIENYEMPKLKPSNPANDYGKYKGSAANHNFVIQNVVDTLNNKTSATTNALEGLKVVDIIERIYNLK